MAKTQKCSGIIFWLIKIINFEIKVYSEIWFNFSNNQIQIKANCFQEAISSLKIFSKKFHKRNIWISIVDGLVKIYFLILFFIFLNGAESFPVPVAWNFTESRIIIVDEQIFTMNVWLQQWTRR